MSRKRELRVGICPKGRGQRKAICWGDNIDTEGNNGTSDSSISDDGRH